MPNNKINKECEFCGKLFRWTSSLALHLRIHTNERPYSCEECGKTFTQKVHLHRHCPVHVLETAKGVESNSAKENRTIGIMDKMENNDDSESQSPMDSSPSSDVVPTTTTAEDIRCQECDTTFDRWLDLLQHTSEAHPRLEDQEMDDIDDNGDGSVNGDSGSKIRTTWCHICKKHLATVSSRNLHMRIHTGERPFACNVCGKAFTQNVHLRSHMSVHTGAKPYACKICNKGFVAGRTLKIHMMSHTREQPHTCQWCSRKFLVRQHLVTHMATHHAEMLHNSSADEDEGLLPLSETPPPTVGDTVESLPLPPAPIQQANKNSSAPSQTPVQENKRKQQKARRKQWTPSSVDKLAKDGFPTGAIIQSKDLESDSTLKIYAQNQKEDIDACKGQNVAANEFEDFWDSSPSVKFQVEPACEVFDSTNSVQEVQEEPPKPRSAVSLKSTSRRKSSSVCRARPAATNAVHSQTSSTSPPMMNSTVDSVSSASTNTNHNHVGSSSQSQPTYSAHSSVGFHIPHSVVLNANDNGVVGTSMQQCPNCMVVEGELQLLKSELTMIKQFLGSKLTLMEQKIDNMTSLIRQ